MKAYELVVFDWDGTLLDSAGDIVAAMQQAIADLALPPRSDEQIRRLIGLGLREAFDQLYPDLDSAALMALIERYRKRFGGSPRVYGQAFPGVEAELLQLRGAGLTLAVATGKSRRGLDRALEAIGWGDHFRATRCADETASKPDPLMLDQLLLELAVEPEMALMVGDTSYDMEMARRAGVDALGVAWGVHPHDELRDAGAQAVLDGVPGLHDWIAAR